MVDCVRALEQSLKGNVAHAYWLDFNVRGGGDDTRKGWLSSQA
jgi:hypothetical protein